MATKETKVEEKVAEAAAAPAVEKKSRAKKAPAKEAAAEAPKAARKPRAPKAVAPVVYLQYGESERDIAALVEAAKADFSANNTDEIKEVKLYVKPEDYMVYYVINGVEGKIAL